MRKLKYTRREAEQMTGVALADDWLTMYDTIKAWADARRDYQQAKYSDQTIMHPVYDAADALAKLVEES